MNHSLPLLWEQNIPFTHRSVMILVTAATAPVGRSIVEQLAAMDHPVRALSRDPENTDLPAEVVAGDLSDPASLKAAMEGVTAVFLLAVVPGFAPAFIQAAKEAGVRRIVFQSSSTVGEPNAIGAFHKDIEDQLRESGLEYTFFRLDVGASDALQWAFDVPSQLQNGDTVRGPWADAQTAPIHPADFAAVIIAALTRDEHANQTYDVSGPVSLTLAEQIRLIGEAHNRPLTYEELSPEEARKAINPYAPADVLFANWEAHRTTPAPTSDIVQRLTGRPARTPSEWAASYPLHPTHP
jgi:uncharacterized protein YbjT (DUF2867 family)